jgi:hypothetical protein
MGTALVITPEGEVSTRQMPDNEGDTLTFLRTHIACDYIDLARLTTTLDMWLDDEGMFNRPVNLLATVLAQAYGLTSQNYYGTAVITGHDGPDTKGLTDDQVRILLAQLGDIREQV